MLVQRHALVNTFRYRSRSPHTSSRRAFSSVLADGFLDLASAMPYPASFPPYATSIILFTIASRLVLTVPFSIWAKKRQWRGEELVVPALQAEKPVVQKRVVSEMQAENIRGTKEELRKVFEERVKKALKARRSELFAEHRCAPLPTMLVPPMTQLPVFIGKSMLFSRMAQPPSVLDSESFLTLTSLAHADPTATLPIALGLITFANVESSRWFMSDAAREAYDKEAERVREKRAQGHLVIQPKQILKTGLRVLSVGRILIGALVPGSVILYWVTSATFGLFQTWVFDLWEKRRSNARHPRISEPQPPSAAQIVEPAIRQKKTPRTPPRK
ncbi:hypothetical protein BV25DRAFT_1791636 [Artomyces pyxidatus]|uniref:Uncharacterized protein n=1 Tax=Artomyces pyxidatus TaxID=48021 RepID=A0ACB8TK41_9AGAM|nr:hypothetical protein BV25DRAFT_1791636 [Artomyces pyxidatus]